MPESTTIFFLNELNLDYYNGFSGVLASSDIETQLIGRVVRIALPAQKRVILGGVKTQVIQWKLSEGFPGRPLQFRIIHVFLQWY